MTKPQVRSLFESMGSICGDVNVRTVSVEGNERFCSWESESTFTVLQETPMLKFKKGQKARMLCSALIWWSEEGKIVRESNYGIWTE